VDSNSLSFLQHLSLVAEKEKQTFMKTNLFYGIVAVAIFIGVITSCGKDDIEIPIREEEQKEQGGPDTPPKKDTVYVIDTTKKTTINEIVYFEEDKYMIVGTGTWQGIAYGNIDG
jgi:hypothetical protein